MLTRVCVQVATFAYMNFAFGECDENEADIILTCVVHRDNEHNLIAFILDPMIKKKSQIDSERDADNHHCTPSPLLTVLRSAIFSLKINSLRLNSTSH